MSANVLANVKSLLFVPGDRPERFGKAYASGAHAVIIDLEDAVSPAAKDYARSVVASWASPERPILLRVNAPGTPWFVEDIKLRNSPGVAGIVLPKAESSEDIKRVAGIAEEAIAVFPLIETAKGMWNALEVASVPGVRQLMFGTIDFMVDMGIEGDGEELDAYKASLVLVSKVAGIQPPIDGVTPAIDDFERLKGDTLNGKRRGFAGKLCIHPKQVPLVNACFRPSEAEVLWARRVLEGVSKADGAAIALDGKMVDRPVVVRAEQIVNVVRES